MSGSVLVVEDEPLIRMDTVDMLEQAGLTVVDFGSAEAAAAYLRENAGDIAAVFTDINLAGKMDGIELARIVASTKPSALLLVTSGRFVTAPEALPDDVRFLKKPWLPLDVITALQEAVAEHDLPHTDPDFKI